MNIFINSSAKCLQQTETIVTFYCVQQFMRSVVQKVDILYEQLIVPEIFLRELKNTLLIEKQVKLTLNHLVTTVCEQEKEKIDPDLFDFEVDFTILL